MISLKSFYYDKDPGTFINYSSTTTNPAAASCNLEDFSHQRVLEDHGSRHRISLLNNTTNKKPKNEIEFPKKKKQMANLQKQNRRFQYHLNREQYKKNFAQLLNPRKKKKI